MSFPAVNCRKTWSCSQNEQNSFIWQVRDRLFVVLLGVWVPVELYRATQLRKGFAKLRGRATYDSLKLAIEVRHGLKAACEGSFANSRVGIEQKRLRFLHSNSREVIGEIHPGRFLEHLAKVMPADVSHLGDPPERQRLRLMGLDKLSRSRHICGLIVVAPYDQLIRQDRKVLRKNTQ